MAEEQTTLDCEVACATAERQRVVALRLPRGATAREAVAAAGLQDEFPELDFSSVPLAIFGAEVSGGTVLNSGDRVDILRSLRRDPRDARRLLASLVEEIPNPRRAHSNEHFHEL